MYSYYFSSILAYTKRQILTRYFIVCFDPILVTAANLQNFNSTTIVIKNQSNTKHNMRDIRRKAGALYLIYS